MMSLSNGIFENLKRMALGFFQVLFFFTNSLLPAASERPKQMSKKKAWLSFSYNEAKNRPKIFLIFEPSGFQ